MVDHFFQLIVSNNFNGQALQYEAFSAIETNPEESQPQKFA